MRIKKLFAMMLALVLSFSVSVAAFAETNAKENEKALEEYYKALAKQQGTVLPISMNVTVKDKKYKVGDKLSAKDFTITVNMSDGTKKKNPTGWTANPLALTTESTEITVVYNGLTTKVTVKANAAVAKQPEQTTQSEAPKPEAKPQQPANDWPASAYEPISAKAKNDIYDYSYTKGFVAKCDNRLGYDVWYVSKGNDSACLFVVLTTEGWMTMYWNSLTTDTYHEEMLSDNSTLEHIYKHMF